LYGGRNFLHTLIADRFTENTSPKYEAKQYGQHAAKQNKLCIEKEEFAWHGVPPSSMIQDTFSGNRPDSMKMTWLENESNGPKLPIRSLASIVTV
jgi:hypothetical protein